MGDDVVNVRCRYVTILLCALYAKRKAAKVVEAGFSPLSVITATVGSLPCRLRLFAFEALRFLWQLLSCLLRFSQPRNNRYGVVEACLLVGFD